MNERIYLNDLVQHQRFKIVGRVKKIVPSKDGKGRILKIETDNKNLPLQSWEEEQVKIIEKFEG